MTWDFSCPDWASRLASGRSIIPPLPLDAAAAGRAVNVFNRLRLPDVVGRPTLGEACGEWFRDIIRAIFGSMQNNVRMVSDVFVLVPKKNSKTTNGAALMLTALLLNVRPQARFALFGPTQEISDIAFQAVSGMIAADDGLSKLLHVQDHLKTITNRATKATLKVTTFDPSVATGGLYAGWLLDEAHLLSRVAYAARVIRQLRGARVAVPESFGVIITTQSDLPPAGAFKTELQYARAVRDGAAGSTGFLPVLYEFPEATQTDKSRPWLNPSLWPQVLPNLGLSVNAEVLRRDLVPELAKGDEAMQVWASQHLNIEIGLALHSDRWRGADFWSDATIDGMDGLPPRGRLAALLARCDVATIGIDGGGLDDLLGLAVIGREKITRRWLHWGAAWADDGLLKLRPEIAATLQGFAADGDLSFVDLAARDAEGKSTANGDIGALVDIVREVHDSGLLPEKGGIGLDPVGVSAILDAMVEAGIPQDQFVGIPQGYKLSGIIAGTARKLKDGTLAHAGQPLMAWSVSNAKSELRGSALLITKQTAGSAKIDPLMALFDAAHLMSNNPVPQGRSVYEAGGIIMV